MHEPLKTWYRSVDIAAICVVRSDHRGRVSFHHWVPWCRVADQVNQSCLPLFSWRLMRWCWEKKPIWRRHVSKCFHPQGWVVSGLVSAGQLHSYSSSLLNWVQMTCTTLRVQCQLDCQRPAPCCRSALLFSTTLQVESPQRQQVLWGPHPQVLCKLHLRCAPDSTLPGGVCDWGAVVCPHQRLFPCIRGLKWA